MTTLIDRNSAGVYVIAATPFDEDGSLDLASTDSMVDFYRDAGADGLTILGIMGEAPKLSSEEALTFARRVLARAEDMPVVVGMSGGGLDPMKALTDAVMAAGAAGVMVAPMNGMGPDDRLRGYFGQVARHLGPDVPICLQDYPQTLNARFSTETILAIAAENPSIVMLKHEEWPGLAKLEQVRAGSGTDAVPRLSILVGNSGLFLPEEMARGADGAMTGFAWPEMMVDVIRLMRAGEAERAQDIFDAYLPLIRYENQLGLGLALRKEALRRRGAIASARVRAPGPSLSRADHDDLTRLTRRLERRLAELGAT